MKKTTELTLPDLEFKTNFREITERSLRLINGSRGALIGARYPDARMSGLEMPPLEKIDFKNDPFRIVTRTCDHWDKIGPVFADLPDDRFPEVMLRYGTGIWAGMLTGEMYFANNTSWVKPFEGKLADLLDRKFPGSSFWFDHYAAAVDRMNERAVGKYFTRIGAEHSALEFVSMIRGTDFYIDLFDDQETMKAVLDKYNHILIDLYKRFDSALDVPAGGNSAWGQLYLGRGRILSDDAGGNISAQTYREFGLPFLRQMSAQLGNCALHIHTLAYHLRDCVSDIPDIIAYKWRQDPNTKTPEENIEYVAEGAERKIVLLPTTSPDWIRKNFPILKQGRYILNAQCENRTEALKIIDFVKENLSPE